MGRGPSRINPSIYGEEDNMIQQSEAGESIHEQAGSTYGKYEGDQEYARQLGETSYEQPLREEPGGKVYLPPSYNRNMFYQDRKSTRLNSSHITISYAVFCLKK